MDKNALSTPVEDTTAPLHQADCDPQTMPLRQPCGPALFAEVISDTGAKPLRFLFGYGELPVSGELHARGDGAELRLFIVVGRLPYTVESVDERRSLLGMIRTFTRELGDTITVSPDQLICVTGTELLTAPVTPSAFVTALITALHGMSPVLESLALFLPDLGPAMPSSASGERAEASPEA